MFATLVRYASLLEGHTTRWFLAPLATILLVAAPLAPAASAAPRPDPAIHIDKFSAAGIFGIRVRNIGNVTLTNVIVRDPRSPACERRLGTMAPGTTKGYVCLAPKSTKEVLNIATVEGTSPSGDTVSDYDDAAFVSHLLPPATG